MEHPLLQCRDVRVEGEGLLTLWTARQDPATSRASAALLRVADTRRFEATITAALADNELGFLFGIAPANARLPEGESFADFVREYPTAFFINSRTLKACFDVKGPFKGLIDDKPLYDFSREKSSRKLKAEIIQYTIWYQEGRLEFRCNGRTFETPPVPVGRYCPAIFMPASCTVSIKVVNMPLGKTAQGDYIRELERSQEDDLRLWRDMKFPDAVVQCDGQEFPVHRALLVNRSPVLDSMLSGARNAKHKPSIQIQGVQEVKHERDEVVERLQSIDEAVSPASVEALLEYIYTTSLPTSANPAEVYSLAHRFKIKPLTELAGARMLEGVTSTNAKERSLALARWSSEGPEALKLWEDMVALLRKDLHLGVLRVLLEEALLPAGRPEPWETKIGNTGPRPLPWPKLRSPKS